nr:MAG TPA: hypothetical protein [Bacteriophage sp.]
MSTNNRSFYIKIVKKHTMLFGYSLITNRVCGFI